MTLRGAALLGGAGLLWLVGRLLGVDELHVVAVAAVALVALAMAEVRLPGGRVTARRRVGANRLPFGGQTEVRLELHNEGRLPTPALTVRDDVPAALADHGSAFAVDGLRPGRSVTLPYRVRGTGRGRYTVGPAELTLTDAFGLARRTRRTHGASEVVVYPHVEALPDAGRNRTPHGRSEGDEHRVLNLGDEFHTMREYVQGDDLRRVHWPSTARQQKLMVRQLELPWRAEVTILLDTRGGVHTGTGAHSTFEAAVSAAASAAVHLAERSHLLRLATEADAAAPEVVDRRTLLDRLAVIAPSPVPNLAGITDRLRGAGGEGLLLACVAPPPGGEPVARAPDTRALVHAGRGFADRAAVVVAPHEAPERGQEWATLLRAAGWRSVVLTAGSSMAEAWPTLLARRTAVAP